MIFLWDYGISKGMGFWRDFFVVPMLCPCYFYYLSMGLLWDSYGISMIFLWDYYGISIESKLKSIESKLKSTENQLKSTENQLKVNWNQLKVNWNQLKINSKSIESKFKSIENQLKVNWNQSKSIDKILFRPRSLKKTHLRESQNCLGGPYTNQDPTLSARMKIYSRQCLPKHLEVPVQTMVLLLSDLQTWNPCSKGGPYTIHSNRKFPPSTKHSKASHIAHLVRGEPSNAPAGKFPRRKRAGLRRQVSGGIRTLEVSLHRRRVFLMFLLIRKNKRSPSLLNLTLETESSERIVPEAILHSTGNKHLWNRTQIMRWRCVCLPTGHVSRWHGHLYHL